MATPYKSLPLRPPKAPNLPIAPVDYTQTYQDQLLNALRLYFNQIDNFGFGLTNTNNGGGGSLLTFPYFSAYQNGVTTLSANMTNVSTTPIQVASTVDFSAAGYILIDNEIVQYTTKTATTFDGTVTRGVKGTTNVAHTTGAYITEVAAVTSTTSAAMQIDTVILSNGITCSAPSSKIYFTNAGIYNIQFSAQLLNYTTSDDNVTIWVRKNGTDVTASAGIQQINPKHGTSPGAIIAGWNYIDSYNAGDYVELVWASETGNTVLATYPPGTAPTHPSSPSLILTVTFVSSV